MEVTKNKISVLAEHCIFCDSKDDLTYIQDADRYNIIDLPVCRSCMNELIMKAKEVLEDDNV